MNQYIDQSIALELTRGGVQHTIFAKQGECSSRRYYITLLHRSAIFEPAGYTAEIIRQTDAGADVAGSSAGGTITVQKDGLIWIPPSGLFAAAGSFLLEVRLSNDAGAIIYSPKIMIEIERSIGASGGVEPLGDLPQYQRIIPELDTIGTDDPDDADQLAIYDQSAGKTVRMALGKLMSKLKSVISGLRVADLADGDQYAKTEDLPQVTEHSAAFAFRDVIFWDDSGIASVPSMALMISNDEAAELVGKKITRIILTFPEGDRDLIRDGVADIYGYDGVVCNRSSMFLGGSVVHYNEALMAYCVAVIGFFDENYAYSEWQNNNFHGATELKIFWEERT